MTNETKKTLSIMMVLTQLGSNVLTFILSLSILKTTQRALDFSSIIIISSIVSVMTSVTIGKLVDKYPKKRMMAVAQFLSSLALVVFLGHYHWAGTLQLWAVISLTVLLNLSDSIFSVSLLASATHLVDKSEELDGFNGLVQTINGLSSLAAPLIAGALFNFFSLTQFVLLEIALEMLSIFFISRLNYHKVAVTTDTEEAEPEQIDLSIKSTWDYIKQEKGLVLFSIGMFGMNLIMGAITIGFPFIMNTYFEGDSFVIGLISFTFSFGMIAASILYPSLNYQGKFYKPTLVGWLVFALGLLLVAMNLMFFASHFYLLAGLLVLATLVMSLAVSASRIPLLSHFQAQVPEQQQGRIFSILDTLIEAAVPLSALLYGLLFDRVSGHTIFFVSGLLLFLYVLVLFAYSQSSYELVKLESSEG